MYFCSKKGSFWPSFGALVLDEEAEDDDEVVVESEKSSFLGEFSIKAEVDGEQAAGSSFWLLLNGGTDAGSGALPGEEQGEDGRERQGELMIKQKMDPFFGNLSL